MEQAAFCGVIYGTKEWTLKGHKDVSPKNCIQQEGDLLYLPDHMQHTVINHGEVIAISGLDAFGKIKHRWLMAQGDPALDMYDHPGVYDDEPDQTQSTRGDL